MRNLSDLFGRKGSASTAKERLRLVLIHDRSTLAPGAMEALRDELVEVISRHVDVDPSQVRLELTQEGRSQRLLADIPLKRRPERQSED
ncbi:MAG: cell division topological specificity factor MinE [Anaerolineales bacterium]|nr:cell division topological specificity factor MinE [Anaerolineales bacterium]MCW5854869.1 cell division topological specificity factor MinE [Anaerolineales bacterium]MCW5878758.1 cell division topological specificity factor MinE [Anaerolineales bacterium]